MKSRFLVPLGLAAVLLLGSASLADGSLNGKLFPTSVSVKAAITASRCIREAVTSLFTPSNDVSVVVPERHQRSHLVREILRETFADRVVKIFTKIPDESPGETRVFLRESSFLLIDDEEDNEKLHRLMNDSFVHRWAEYIAITGRTTEWLEKFSDHLWNLGFIKVAFVQVEPNGSSTFFRPIQESSSRDSIPTLKAFDLCEKHSESELPEKKIAEAAAKIHPFSSMLQTPTWPTLKFAKILEGTASTSDLNAAKMNVTRWGIGIEIMQMFATKYHLQLVRRHWKNEDTSSWMNARDRCEAGEFDFFYARELAPRQNCCERIDVIAWYSFETLVFVDSLRSSLHPLRGLFLPYRGYVWLCTFLLLALFALFAWVIDIFWGQSLVRERITVLQIWSVFVGQALPRLPVKFGLRFVLGLWIIYTVHNTLLYSGMFSSALTTSEPSNMIASFQDILDSGRPICGSEKTKLILNDTEEPALMDIHDRFEEILSTNVFSKILDENYIGSRHVRHVIEHNWYNRANDSLRLYIPAEATIVSYPSPYYAKSRHPYSKDFNTLVSNARDAGILAYLMQQYAAIVGKAQSETLLASTDETYIQMKHLRVMFNILLIGHFVSCLVFLVELFMPGKSSSRRG